jgi:4,5-DOPA dioxygenase extradiol
MSSPLHPGVAGGAFDAFLRDTAPSSRAQRTWVPSDGPMPALYLSHGAPPLFDDPLWISQLFRWSQALPKPTAVLIVSAHWEAAPISLSASAAGTPLVYDFGGFARRYFQMTYATPGAGALAARVAAAMPAGEPVHQHASRGLDHGAWVPLKIMYPYADVPVLQLSMPTHDPDRLLSLGRRLR